MVVKKVMSLSRWAPPAPARRKRKCKVTVKVVGLEGLPPLPGDGGRVAAVEVRWRQPPKVGALAYLMGRKKQARSVSSRRPVMEDSWAVRWDRNDDDEANRFENVCRLCDPESVADPVYDVSFSILYPSSFQEDNLSENGKQKDSAESDEDDDPVGSWRSKEFISRDKQTKLKVQTFFASIDQRDPSAGGESACTAIAAVIASALHDNELNTPTRSEFDALIREGSSEWQKLCNNATYIESFPDKHFDLETVLEAKIKPISVSPDKSFIGFFRPENFKSLHGAMSFDDIWHEITSDLGGDSKVYIVGWNDHFFMLKLEANAYYVMDTLGERLHEGCKKAYILRFDDSSEMCRWQENKAIEDSEELICRGKECCREFINRFLAAIPLQEELELEEKGVGINTALHQRLQIEFHLTEASVD
ncbi:hypothetical protein BHE74_00054803 [Ensete ventricosum]|nr:hypothetical protein BHE74_00054803 [Ensete ventricosum]